MIDPKQCFDFHLSPIPEPPGSGFLASLTVPVGTPYFEGHFPGNPVLPAVAILDITEVILRRIQGDSFRLTAAPSAKFLGVVTPGLKVRIELTPSGSEKGEWNATWMEEGSSERVLARLRLSLSPDDIGD